MLYKKKNKKKNNKAVLLSPDGNTDFFNLVARFWLGDALYVLYGCNLPRLRTSNVNVSKKWFYTKKKKGEDSVDNPQKLWQTKITPMI